jgi:guanylate kinase
MPDCRTIFILPPSRVELERRLRTRGTDTEAVIQRRLRDATGDISHWSEFDYVVVNDQFEQGLGDLAAVVSGNGDPLRSTRPALRPLLADLLAG